MKRIVEELMAHRVEGGDIVEEGDRGLLGVRVRVSRIVASTVWLQTCSCPRLPPPFAVVIASPASTS